MAGMKSAPGIFLRGVAMGAADVVPGVSGGTVAFITGIYERLLTAVGSFDLNAAAFLLRRDVKSFRRHIDGGFLFFLGLGIAASVLTLSRGVLYLLESVPQLLWAFFFGLIVASALVVGKSVSRWRPRVVTAGGFGLCLGYIVTVAVPAETPEALWFVFLAGALAICAMILPGISGSFILVLLSKYAFVFTAIRDFNLPVIVVFGTGAAVGLLAFARVLKALLARFRDSVIAGLTGVMVGSLNKVWPWQHAVETYLNSKGLEKPLIVENVSPVRYEALTGRDPMITAALLLAVGGFMLVFIMHRLAVRKPPAARPVESS